MSERSTPAEKCFVHCLGSSSLTRLAWCWLTRCGTPTRNARRSQLRRRQRLNDCVGGRSQRPSPSSRMFACRHACLADVRINHLAEFRSQPIRRAIGSPRRVIARANLNFAPSPHLNHLKIILAHPALRAHKIRGHIRPRGTRRDAFNVVTFGFVVNPAADDALPFAHRVLKAPSNESR